MNFEFQRQEHMPRQGVNILRRSTAWVICAAQGQEEVEGDLRERVRMILDKYPGTLICKPLHATRYVTICLETKLLGLNIYRDKWGEYNCVKSWVVKTVCAGGNLANLHVSS